MTAERRYLIARLLFLLRVAPAAAKLRLLQAIDLSPKCPWPAPTSGREVELTRERGDQ